MQRDGNQLILTEFCSSEKIYENTKKAIIFVNLVFSLQYL